MTGVAVSQAVQAAWKTAVKQLRAEPWYRPGGWTVRATGKAGLQLSKKNWFNEDGHGIHFETWTTPEDLERGALPFQAHIMHAGQTFPGTTSKASALSRPVIARCGETIRGWGYKLPRAPGMTLLSARVPFASEGELPQIVVRECRRFVSIAPVIDEVLGYVLEGKRPPRVKAAPKPKADPTPLAWGDSILPAFTGLGEEGPGWYAWTEAKGQIDATADKRGVLRVVIGPKSRHGYHAALCCSGLPFAKGRRYRVSFDIKAQADYRIAGQFSQASKPHLTVGFFPGRTVTTEWSTATWEFEAERDEPDTRLMFALGKMPNTVWIRHLSLCPARSA